MTICYLLLSIIRIKLFGSDADLLALPITNNSVEGRHRGFSQLIGANHPTVWEFNDALKTELNMHEMTIEQYIARQLGNPSQRLGLAYTKNQDHRPRLY